MRKITVSLLALVAVLCVAAPALRASASAFDDGKADRRAWEEWFASQTGDYKKGAEFWAGERSKPKPGSCYAPDGSSTGNWTQGCLAAQRQLADPDVRRKAEPEYRRGWQTFTGLAPQPAPSSASQAGSTAPAPTNPPSSSTFNEGLADRRELEAWFASLTGDFKKGVEYWAGQRSLPKPGSCNAPDGTSKREWTRGCLAAQEEFAQGDARRKAEPEYKAGWNSYTPTASPAAGASAPAPTPQMPPVTLAPAATTPASPSPEAVVSAPAPQAHSVAPAPGPTAGNPTSSAPTVGSTPASSLQTPPVASAPAATAGNPPDNVPPTALAGEPWQDVPTTSQMLAAKASPVELQKAQQAVMNAQSLPPAKQQELMKDPTFSKQIAIVSADWAQLQSIHQKLGDDPWNDPAYHRAFQAVNPDGYREARSLNLAHDPVANYKPVSQAELDRMEQQKQKDFDDWWNSKTFDEKMTVIEAGADLGVPKQFRDKYLDFLSTPAGKILQRKAGEYGSTKAALRGTPGMSQQQIDQELRQWIAKNAPPGR